jgi:transcriptional regulator with XRE-family HTH domain
MDRAELTNKIGANIRKYRLSNDISQEALSLSAGLHPAYLGRLERGEKCPTIDTLYKICDALGISVCEILNFENNSNSSNSEVMFRIERALKNVSEPQQIKIAEIVENIAQITFER